MGLFSSVKSTYKKSEAAVVVQNLLTHQAQLGNFELDPAKSANTLVEAIWRQKPSIFDGSFGQRPHKLSVAAAALAYAVNGSKGGSLYKSAFVLALGAVLSEFETNGRLYALNGIDHTLLQDAMSVFGQVAREMGIGGHA